MLRDRTDSTGAMPIGALVAVSLAMAAVVGLIVGAIWGLSGTRSATSPPPTGSTTSTPIVTPSDTATSTVQSPLPSVSDTGKPTATGAVPAAPATTTTSADGWRLGSWRITSSGGTLGVDTTARNTSTGTRSADLVLYVYVDGQHIATTTARVTDVAAGDSVPVQFTGPDPWKPGKKVLLLQVP